MLYPKLGPMATLHLALEERLGRKPSWPMVGKVWRQMRLAGISPIWLFEAHRGHCTMALIGHAAKHGSYYSTLPGFVPFHEWLESFDEPEQETRGQFNRAMEALKAMKDSMT